MSKELRMMTECLLLLCAQPQLSFSPPFRHILNNMAYTGMTSELVMLERLSQLAAFLLSVMLLGVFVWWCFLFGAISPFFKEDVLNTSPSPTPNLLHCLPSAVRSARLQLP